MNILQTDFDGSVIDFGNNLPLSINQILSKAEMVYFLIDQVNELIDILNGDGHDIENILKPVLEDGTDLDLVATLSYQETLYCLTSKVNECIEIINGGGIDILSLAKAYTDEKIAIVNTSVSGLVTQMSELSVTVGDLNTSFIALSTSVGQYNTRISNLEGVSHTHSNKTILDATTQAYTVADKTKLDSLSGNAEQLVDDHNVSADAHSVKFGNKLDVNSANSMIKDVSYNGTTGVFVFTKYDNTTITVDIPIEGLIASGYYDYDTNELVLVTSGGFEIRIPASGLIGDYTGSTTATIQCEINASNVISCNIVANSVTKNLLSVALQTEIDDLSLVKHSHSNKTILDAIEVAYTTAKDTILTGIGTAITDLQALAHSHSNKSVLDATEVSYTNSKDSDLATAKSSAHTHSNKNILDVIEVAYTTAKDTILTGIGTAITDLQAVAHSHSNKSVLDLTTASFTTTALANITKAIEGFIVGSGANYDLNTNESFLLSYQSGSTNKPSETITDNGLRLLFNAMQYKLMFALQEGVLYYRSGRYVGSPSYAYVYGDWIRFGSKSEIDNIKPFEDNNSMMYVGNLNDLPSGVRRCSGTATNVPVGYLTGRCETIVCNNSGESVGQIVKTQLFSTDSYFAVYLRTFANGIWGSWTNFASTSYVTSVLSTYGITNGNIAPAYSASSPYGVGAFVRYNNSLYRCATAIATGEAFNVTKWTSISLIDWLTVQTVATSVSNPTYGTNNSSVLSKVGKTVTFNIFYNNNVAAIPTGSATIFTLPVGSRPAINTYVTCRCLSNPSTNSVILICRTDGTVTYDDNIGVPLGCYIDGSVSFITNQ